MVHKNSESHSHETVIPYNLNKLLIQASQLNSLPQQNYNKINKNHNYINKLVIYSTTTIYVYKSGKNHRAYSLTT